MTTLHSPSALPTRLACRPPGRRRGFQRSAASDDAVGDIGTGGRQVPAARAQDLVERHVPGRRRRDSWQVAGLEKHADRFCHRDQVRGHRQAANPLRDFDRVSARPRLFGPQTRQCRNRGTISGLAGALLGSSIKSTDHYVLLEYLLPDGSPSAVLLRLHKDNQQEIIAALRGAIPPTEPGPAPKACRRLRYGDTAGPGIADRSGSSRERIG